MAKIDKFQLLGSVADMTKQIEQLEQDRHLTAAAAASQGATATELAACLQVSRATAHRRYLDAT